MGEHSGDRARSARQVHLDQLRLWLGSGSLFFGMMPSVQFEKRRHQTCGDSVGIRLKLATDTGNQIVGQVTIELFLAGMLCGVRGSSD